MRLQTSVGGIATRVGNVVPGANSSGWLHCRESAGANGKLPMGRSLSASFIPIANTTNFLRLIVIGRIA